MNSGGKREGSGRKPMNPEEKRKQVHIYVAPITAVRIQSLRNKGINIGRHLDKIIEDLDSEKE